MKILGFEHANLTFKDGNKTSGYFFYLHDEDAKNVTGIKTERAFVSDTKCGSYVPKIGDRIVINYNRYGSIRDIQRVSTS